MQCLLQIAVGELHKNVITPLACNATQPHPPQSISVFTFTFTHVHVQLSGKYLCSVTTPALSYTKYTRMHLIAFRSHDHFFLRNPLGGEHLVRLPDVQRSLAQEVWETARHHVAHASRRATLRGEVGGGQSRVVKAATPREVAENALVSGGHYARFFSDL